MDPKMYLDTFRMENHFWWFAGMREIGRAMLGPYFGPGRPPADILDVGCGTGAHLAYLKEFGRPVGLDFSQDACQFSRSVFDGSVYRASADDLPFADESFDLVATMGVLCQQAVRSDVGAMREICRVLRPGGYIFLRVPAYPWLYSHHDRVAETRERYSTQMIVDRMEQAGFDVVQVTHANMLLFPIALVKRLIDKVYPLQGEHQGDIQPVPEPLNWLFTRLLSAEAPLISRGSLPVGLSLMALGRKPIQINP